MAAPFCFSPMETITLKYGSNQQDFRVKSVKGLGSPDEIQLHPAVQHELLDGVLDDDILSYRRIVTIEFGVIQDDALKAFIVNFMISRQKTLIYNAESVDVSLYDPKGYTYEWRNNIKFASALTLRFKERNTNTTLVGYPPSPLVGAGYLSANNEWTGLNTFLGGIVLGDQSYISSASFIAGMLGSGTKWYRDVGGKWNLEVDKLRVRGSAAFMEVLFQQTRAVNGSLWISSTGKVKLFELVQN